MVVVVVVVVVVVFERHKVNETHVEVGEERRIFVAAV